MSPSPFLYVGPSPAGFFPTDTQAEGRFSAPRPIHLPCFAKPLPSLLRALFLSNTLISPGSFSSAFQCTQVSSNVKTTNTKTPPIFPHLYTTIWLSSFSLFTSYQPNCPEELPNLSQGSQDPLGAKTHKGLSVFIQVTSFSGWVPLTDPSSIVVCSPAFISISLDGPPLALLPAPLSLAVSEIKMFCLMLALLLTLYIFPG